MKIVIDFTGYYYGDIFIIKEFCQYKVRKADVVLDKLMVTKRLEYWNANNDVNNSIYKNFYEQCGIRSELGDYFQCQLRKFVHQSFKSGRKIFIRSREQSDLLFRCIGKKYCNIKYLNEIGYNVNPITRTDCVYHHNPDSNYCARTNAFNMAKWLLIKRHDKIILLDHMHGIIDFTGYYCNEKFIIKELGLVVLNSNEGTYIDWLCVTEPPKKLKNLLDTVREYNNNYYDTYGIRWESGYFNHFKIRSTLNTTLEKYHIKSIYVRTENEENILREMVSDKYDVIRLDQFNFRYSENSEPFQCSYHKHSVARKNVCVGNSVTKMLNLVWKFKIFEPGVRRTVKTLMKTGSNISRARRRLDMDF